MNARAVGEAIFLDEIILYVYRIAALALNDLGRLT
jgi:hypothetical protein